MNACARCLSNLLHTKKKAVVMGTEQGLAVEWSVQAIVSLVSNQYSLIIYRDSLCPGAWAKRAPARRPPARPAALVPTQGPGSAAPTMLLWESLLCLLAVEEGPPAKPSGA